MAIVLEATTKKIPKQTNKQDAVHYCASAEGVKVAVKVSSEYPGLSSQRGIGVEQIALKKSF